MLDLLNPYFKDVLTSPAKLLALCLVVFLASTSFVVSLFLAMAVCGKLAQTLKRKAKALEAAEAEAERARAEAERVVALDALKQAAAVAQPAPPAPARQYARSAVVIPLKRTGTHT